MIPPLSFKVMIFPVYFKTKVSLMGSSGKVKIGEGRRVKARAQGEGRSLQSLRATCRVEAEKQRRKRGNF